MNTSRDRRLARLEQAQLAQEPRPTDKIIYVWRDAPRESAEQAIARRCPNGVPPGACLVICSWQAEGSAAAMVKEV
jgi:hypothetical protein